MSVSLSASPSESSLSSREFSQSSRSSSQSLMTAPLPGPRRLSNAAAHQLAALSGATVFDQEIKANPIANSGEKANVHNPQFQLNKNGMNISHDPDLVHTITHAVHFNHYSPLLLHRDEYFMQETLDKSRFDGCMSIVVACFNEAAQEVRVTLHDLYIQHQEMIRSGQRMDMHVCLILDGWSKASKSIKTYVKSLFPCQPEEAKEMGLDKKTNWIENWHQYIDEWDRESEETIVDTLILQQRSSLPGNPMAPVAIDFEGNWRRDPSVKLTVMIKRDNRRKHNSHEWYLCAFAPIYSIPIYSKGHMMQFAFMTDTGTRFHESCLQILTEHMLQNPTVVATSGRQRVMTYDMQYEAEKKSAATSEDDQESESLWNSIYRASQGFDYEASVTSFNGAFSAFGMLPVIPGPCGLFRLDLLSDQSPELLARRCAEEYIKLTVATLHGHQSKQQKQVKDVYFALQKYNNARNAAIAKKKGLLTLKEQVEKERQFGVSGMGIPADHDQLSSPASVEFDKSTFGMGGKIQEDYKSERNMNNIQLIKAAVPASATVVSSVGTSSPLSDISPDTSLASAKKPSNKFQKQFPSTEEEIPLDRLILNLITTEQNLDREQSLILCYFKFMLEVGEVMPMINQYKVAVDAILEQVKMQSTVVYEQIKILNTLLDSSNLLHMQEIELNLQETLANVTQTLNSLLSKQFQKFKSLTSIVQSSLSNAHSSVDIRQKMIARLSVDDEINEMVELEQSKAELRAARDPVEFYFRCVNKNPTESGLLLGCLLLAEDRVLSYASVLKCPHPEPVTTAFIPDALFYFQAETEAEKLVQQRRRWTNGTVAGYFWLLEMKREGMFDKPGKENPCRSFSAIWMYMLFAFQLLQYAVVAISPGIWALSLQFSLKKLFDNSFDDWIIFCYFAFYTMFVYLHCRPSETRLHSWLWHSFTVVNAAVMCLNVYTVTELIISYIDGLTSSSNFFTYQFVITTIVLGTMIAPYLLALLHDIHFFAPSIFYRRKARGSGLHFQCLALPTPRQLFKHSALVRMFYYAIPFYLFLPTFVGLLPVYSFCRTWELSWGNRPSGSLHSYSNNSNKSSEAASKTKKEMFEVAYIICGALWALNLFGFLVCLELQVNEYFLLIMTFMVLGWALLQMIISFFWIAGKIILGPFLAFFNFWLHFFAAVKRWAVSESTHDQAQKQLEEAENQIAENESNPAYAARVIARPRQVNVLQTGTNSAANGARRASLSITNEVNFHMTEQMV